jgi:hypothetical protein
LKRAVNPPVSTFGASTRDPNVPRHVAIVMDGNGRWAKKRFMPRIFGHKHGVDALVSTIQACANRGVEHLTVFAFSSENWKRPEEEVSGLMGLVLSAMTRYLTKIAGDGVRVRIIGDRDAVSQTVRNAWERAEKTTAHNTRITVWVAFNYGGRWDIVQACQRAIAGRRAGQRSSPRRRCRATWRSARRRIPTCSSAPAARCASATSCCGRWRIPSCISPIACGPTSTTRNSTAHSRSTPRATAVSAA